VRAYLDGHLVVDSARPLLVWESPRYPTYWFPEDDVHAVLRPTADDPLRSDLVATEGVVAEGAARRAPDSAALAGHVAFRWSAMTEWLEEDEPVYVHARDPYTRVDVLRSSRHVTVSLEGQVLADSVRPTLLFETGLRPRYYLPLSDVVTELLEPSDTVSACPYKGTANYWSVRIGDATHPDLAWTYRTPLPEAQKIAGLVCFYDERVDLTVDP
jgi:uncharacterized protein (DUF427 family)